MEQAAQAARAAKMFEFSRNNPDRISILSPHNISLGKMTKADGFMAYGFSFAFFDERGEIDRMICVIAPVEVLHMFGRDWTKNLAELGIPMPEPAAAAPPAAKKPWWTR